MAAESELANLLGASSEFLVGCNQQQMNLDLCPHLFNQSFGVCGFFFSEVLHLQEPMTAFSDVQETLAGGFDGPDIYYGTY